MAIDQFKVSYKWLSPYDLPILVSAIHPSRSLASKHRSNDEATPIARQGMADERARQQSRIQGFWGPGPLCWTFYYFLDLVVSRWQVKFDFVASRSITLKGSNLPTLIFFRFENKGILQWMTAWYPRRSSDCLDKDLLKRNFTSTLLTYFLSLDCFSPSSESASSPYPLFTFERYSDVTTEMSIQQTLKAWIVHGVLL